jgi:hypothetical protein
MAIGRSGVGSGVLRPGFPVYVYKKFHNFFFFFFLISEVEGLKMCNNLYTSSFYFIFLIHSLSPKIDTDHLSPSPVSSFMSKASHSNYKFGNGYNCLTRIELLHRTVQRTDVLT